jgi:hypothetical protein
MPEMTTSVRWTADETKRVVLLGFSALTLMNVARRLLRERRVGSGEALAGIASFLFLLLEFGHRPKEETPSADGATPESSGAAPSPA